MDEIAVYETIATHLELLPALQRAETVYDRNTAQHSARVAKIGALTGEVLGLSSADVGVLTWVGALHDIGKLTVSEGILQKQGGRLSESEWAEMRGHAVAGESLVMALGPRLEPMAEAVRSHHERWDGSGYPDGLCGDDIPLMARIVAVADAFDLLTHEQPWRHEAFDHASGVEMVTEGRGVKFDPRVVDAFVHLDRRGLLAPISASMQYRPQAPGASAAHLKPAGNRCRTRQTRATAS